MDSLEHTAAKLGFDYMTVKDWKDLQRACKKVFELMKDGQWHHASTIIKASGQREGLRRMRELRGIGFLVEERRLLPDDREWIYRLVLNLELLEQAMQKQGELFG